jgi:thiol-disulfide isomerase/thioredoxin
MDVDVSPAVPAQTSLSTERSRRRWLVGAMTTVAVVAGGSGAWWRLRTTSATAGEQLGAEFWQQTFQQPDGATLSFAALRNKPLLVNFWATWCPPCIEELPMLERFSREQAANGWQVVGLAIDQPSAVRKFLERVSVSFPMGLAGLQGTELIRQLGNSGGGLPFTIALGADGNVLGRKMGKLEPADLDAWQRGLVHG